MSKPLRHTVEPDMPFPPGAILRRPFHRANFFHYGVASEFYHPNDMLQMVYQFGGVYEGELQNETWQMRLLNRVWSPSGLVAGKSHTGWRVGLTDWVRFSEGLEVEVVEVPEDPIPVLNRAREMLHRTDYNLLTRNCEHFANYAAHGDWRSDQAGLTVGAVLDGLGAVVSNLLRGGR